MLHLRDALLLAVLNRHSAGNYVVQIVLKLVSSSSFSRHMWKHCLQFLSLKTSAVAMGYSTTNQMPVVRFGFSAHCVLAVVFFLRRWLAESGMPSKSESQIL